jgi:hypothetical protein
MSIRRRPVTPRGIVLIAIVANTALVLAHAFPVSADVWSTPGPPATPASRTLSTGAPDQPYVDKSAGAAGAAPAPLTRLGSIGPLTGARASAGVILRVAQAIIARGGAGELVVKDDGAMPLRTIPAARFLENVHRVEAFVSPLETASVASLLPYLAHTKTPTLFLSTNVSHWTAGPNVIGFPPPGSGTTQVLAETMRRVVDERVSSRRGEPAAQGVWVIWVDTDEGRDRVAGFRKARLAGVTEIGVQPDTKTTLPAATAPEAVLIVGAARDVAELAGRIVALPPACVATGMMSPCAPPPAIFAAVFEPYDWTELASIPTLTVADWLRTDAPTLAWHRTVLEQILPGQRPSRLTLWGHALGELTNEVLRRAGRDANGAKLLEAARSLHDWSSRLLPAISLGAHDRWPIEQIAITTLTRGRPSEMSTWLAVPRP